MENSFSNKFNRFYDSLSKLIRIYLVGIVIFMVFRIMLIYSFGDLNELILYKSYLVKAFWFGFRFDTMVLYYFMIPVVLLMLIGFALPAKNNYLRFMNSFIRWYFIVVFSILILVQIIDYYFFKFFQSHFNLLVFGIFDDDTQAVLQSVWTDYPVILISAVLVIMFFLLRWLFTRISRREVSNDIKYAWSKISILVLFLCIFFLGMRSSLGTFPLLKDDATISPNNFINTIVPNGVFALTDAFSERSHFSIDADMDKTLREYGFDNTHQVVEAFLGRELSNCENPVDSLFVFTPVDPFLENNPPNVVFVLMESMSNFYLDLHSEKFNLLGALEPVMENCYVYRNFVSVQNGTIHTLEGLMLNSPLIPLSQSRYFEDSFSTSCALPFYEKGYHTAFITGAKLGWRNLGSFVGSQYFQQVEGNSVILDKVKGAVECEWGVYDEFMFERIFQSLNKSSEQHKPAFIFGFSTSNHTPFEHPDSYKPYPLQIPDSVVQVLRTGKEIAVKNFTNYQYANDCLGKFIERVRNSPLGKNTIIVATGDHNTLQLFNFSDKQLLQKLSVPLVLYVPEQYRKNPSPDIRLFASHKDIFPTIFNLSLSHARYSGLGNNLFDDSKSRNDFFALNEFKTALNEYGAIITGNPPLFYKWETQDKKSLVPTNSDETPQLKTLPERVRLYKATATLAIQNEIRKRKTK